MCHVNLCLKSLVKNIFDHSYITGPGAQRSELGSLGGNLQRSSVCSQAEGKRVGTVSGPEAWACAVWKPPEETVDNHPF